MFAIMVNPFPAILLHNVTIVALAVVVWVLSRRRHLAVAVAFAAGLGLSLLWRNVSFDFAVAWQGLLYEAVFRWPFDGEARAGFLVNWLLPITLAYVGIALWKRQWEKRQSRARMLMAVSGVVLVVALCTWLLWPMDIYSAANRGELRRVEAILRRHPEAANERRPGGRTPLRSAIWGGQDAAVKLLLDAGADPNATDDDGMTPLLLPIFAGRAETVEMLLDAGADANARNTGGTTPLHQAALYGEPDVVSALLQAGADPAAQDDRGQTPLSLASELGNKEAAELLIAHGADPNARDNDGRTPLHRAVRDNSTACAQVLLDNGATVDVVDKWGDTALDEALKNGNQKMIALLRAHGARERTDERQARAAGEALPRSRLRSAAEFTRTCPRPALDARRIHTPTIAR